ncbi:hypothetical protein, partial [Neisseria meningitidis]|uniref:hypothetical protein n=1 Tax=Neisseria meningitidis TaxID=487 RepID=UPI001C86CFAC
FSNGTAYTSCRQFFYSGLTKIRTRRRSRRQYKWYGKARQRRTGLNLIHYSIGFFQKPKKNRSASWTVSPSFPTVRQYSPQAISRLAFLIWWSFSFIFAVFFRGIFQIPQKIP